MIRFFGGCVLCLVLAGWGSSNPMTSAQERSALQGAWSGSGVGIGSASSGYTGTAAFTVSGSEGSLAIPSTTCSITFNVPLIMQPGKTLAVSGFFADGLPDVNGYGLSELRGTFISSSQLTLIVPFQTPCQSQAIDAQFTLTKH
jgi:hypothetical protein